MQTAYTIKIREGIGGSCFCDIMRVQKWKAINASPVIVHHSRPKSTSYVHILVSLHPILFEHSEIAVSEVLACLEGVHALGALTAFELVTDNASLHCADPCLANMLFTGLHTLMKLSKCTVVHVHMLSGRQVVTVRGK